MRDLITSGVKTAVQVGVAAAVAWAANLGIDVDSVALEAAMFSIAVGGVAFVLNWAGQRFPIINTILSFGLASNSPTYK